MVSDQIESKNIPIILALIKEPIATDVQVAAMLEKLNTEPSMYISTIHRRIKKLEAQNIIQGAGAIINFSKIGLALHSFIIETSEENWEYHTKVIETFCDLHPYTYFRNRIFGAKNGLYVVFNLPKNDMSIEKLIQCLIILKNKGHIKNYTHYPKLETLLNYNGNISKWDASKNGWNVDFNELETIFSSHSMSRSKKGPTFIEPINLKKLNMLDMIILREATINARRSQMEILRLITDEKYDQHQYYANKLTYMPLSKQTFSRRFKNLEDEGIISGYNLFYDRSKFGIFNQGLFIGKYYKGKLNQLVNIIMEDKLPFPSNIVVDNRLENFIFWINLPPIEITKVTEFLLKYFGEVEFYLFGRNPDRYYFWHDNFDGNTKEWKTSDKWIIVNPITQLEEFLSERGDDYV